jgi:hypothetical protein
VARFFATIDSYFYGYINSERSGGKMERIALRRRAEIRLGLGPDPRRAVQRGQDQDNQGNDIISIMSGLVFLSEGS